jgi:hypothetical protein
VNQTEQPANQPTQSLDEIAHNTLAAMCDVIKVDEPLEASVVKCEVIFLSALRTVASEKDKEIERLKSQLTGALKAHYEPDRGHIETISELTARVKEMEAELLDKNTKLADASMTGIGLCADKERLTAENAELRAQLNKFTNPIHKPDRMLDAEIEYAQEMQAKLNAARNAEKEGECAK